METISDCNTYNKIAVGRITDSTAHRPFNYGVLQNVLYSTSGYRGQFAIAVTSDTYAFRRSSDGGATWSDWQELALNSNITNMGHVKKDSIASGNSATIAITKPAFVSVGRASVSANTTTAFIDGWAGIIYISNNTAFTLSVSGDNLTITNNSGSYINYIVMY